MANIIVTGAAGFLASHTCEALIKKGQMVFAIDNGSTKNIPKELHKNKDFCIIKGDTLNLEKINVKKNMDVLIHFASITGKRYFSGNKVNQAIKINVFGIQNTLEFAKKNKVKRFIYISTPSVTKCFSNALVDEADVPFIVSKLCAENMVKSYCIENGLEYMILRIFDSFGERINGTAYWSEIQNLLSKSKVKLERSRDSLVSYNYVANTAEGICKSCFAKPANKIVDIGSYETKPVSFFVKKIKKFRKVKVTYSKQRVNDYPNVKESKRILGDYNKICFEEALEHLFGGKE